MQSALVHSPFLFLCRSFSSSSSPSLYPFFFFRCVIHSFIHLPSRHFCHTPCLFHGSVFFSHSLVPPTMFSSVLWQSFLGFITSSGDIPPFFSPFLPLLYPLRSLHFHFLWLQEGEKRGSLSFCFLCHLDCSERKDEDRGKELQHSEYRCVLVTSHHRSPKGGLQPCPDALFYGSTLFTIL